MNNNVWLEALIRRFTEAGDPKVGEKMQAYMKDIAPYYGIQAPLRKTISSEIIKKYGWPDPLRIPSIFNQIYHQKERELKYVAIDWMVKKKRLLSAADIPMLEQWIVKGTWWDTTDGIASNLIGHLAKDFSVTILDVLNEWNQGDNLWLIRSSIIFQLKYKENTNPEILEAMCQPHLHDNRFFIKKAIGWALRAYSKTHPQWVRQFLDKYDVQKLTYKEASKYL